MNGLRQQTAARTDADGRVTWKLRPARYEVGVARADGTLAQEQSTIVDWTAGGPSPADVRISAQRR